MVRCIQGGGDRARQWPSLRTTMWLHTRASARLATCALLVPASAGHFPLTLNL